MPDNAQNITEQDIIFDFQEYHFNLTILESNSIYSFNSGRLYSNIIPQNSNVKIIKTKSDKKKIKVNLAKVNTEREWSNLIK